jgi:dGTPase
MAVRMDWVSLLDDRCTPYEGCKDELEARDNIRNQYLRDYDRVVFSPSFRRLGRKTQVHPMAKNDHVHTRLTHSLEVASVGRSLGFSVAHFISEVEGLPKYVEPIDLGFIVQAACLAHDIGNPPFGHAGEYAIRDWFASNLSLLHSSLTEQQVSDLVQFEGNAQGFRLVTKIENHYYNGGLRLSAATLGTLIKYPWFSNSCIGKEKAKFNIFSSESDTFSLLAKQLGLLAINNERFSRHPLSYLMEAADDICYRILDIEDALEIGVLRFDDISGILEKIAETTIIEEKHQKMSVRRRIVPYRAAAISNIILKVSDIFKENYEAIMLGNFDGDLIEGISGSVADGLRLAKSLTKNVIFNDQRKVELEVGAYSIISIILKAFITAVNELKEKNDISFKSDRILSLMAGNRPGKHDTYYDCYMKISDYVSGMTDDYATFIAGQIGGHAR